MNYFSEFCYMKNKYQAFIIVAILAIFVLAPLISVDANSGLEQAQSGLNKSASKGFLGSDGSNGDDLSENDYPLVSIPGTIGRIIGAGLSLVGIIFFVLLVYGGFLWMTARGNEAQVKEAKDLITAAVIGLIVVLSAYAITAFIGQQLFTQPEASTHPGG